MLKKTPLKRGTSQLKKSALKKAQQPLKKTSGLKKSFKPKQNQEDLGKMWEMFLQIWEERKHPDGRNYSELSGEYLGKEAKSTMFHHIFEKGPYPQYKFDKKNIILITWEEHSQVHLDTFYYDEINRRRVLLKEFYNKNGFTKKTMKIII